MMRRFTHIFYALFTTIFLLGSLNLSAQLSGNYTIDPNGSGATNYTSFANAVSALNSGGVSGPVVFTVANATFTEKVTLGAISGASSTNTITFNGAGVSSTILQYAGTSYSNRATILFNGGDYFTFRNMKIQATGGSYGTVIHFMNSSDHNTIDSCDLIVTSTSSSSYFNCVLSSGSESSYSYSGNNGDYNTISNCKLRNGYYGVRFNGGGSTSPDYGNKISNCDLQGHYYYGIYTYYQRNDVFEYNSISNLGSTTSYGLYTYYSSSSTINGNIIMPGRYGIYLYRENYYYTTSSSLVSNNMVTNFAYTYHYGIRVYYYCYNVKVLHNTVRVAPGTTSYSYPALYLYYAYYPVVKNNIFINEGSNGILCYIYNSSFNNGDIDYNDYYKTGGSYFVYQDGSQYSNLSAWKTAYSYQNQNSWDLNPGITSSTDLHLGGGGAIMSAPTLSDVPLDIDKESRGATMSIIGADEPPAMKFDSVSASTITTSSAFQGQQKVKLLQATINVSGAINPLSVDTAYFTTSGTTSLSDVSSISFYSQDGSPLNDLYEVERVIPTSTIKIIPPAGTTVGDISKLIVAFNLSPNATIGDSLDVSFEGVYVDDTLRTPNVTNPVGSRTIVHPASYTGYCDVTRINTGNYAIGIKRIIFESIDNSTITLAGGLPPNGTAVQTYGTPIPTVYKQLSYPFKIYHGELNPQSANIYVDWNNDGYFDASTEYVTGWQNQPEATINTTSITIPCSATPGIHRMRIASDYGPYSPAPCGTTYYGEVEDYFINVIGESTPVVSFTMADSAYVGGLTKFFPVSSIDGNIDFLWDYNNDGNTDDTADVGEYIFTTSGSHTVVLKAVLYGCEDTLTSSPYSGMIQVVTPVSAPIVNFISNLNTVTTAIPVEFSDLTKLGPNTWKWRISPKIINGNSAYTFVPSDDVSNPTVNFHELGNFTVTLVATNSVGTDSSVKVDYITVVKENLMCSDNWTDLRSGYVYDDGGKNGNYSNPTSGTEQTCGFLIQPKCASSVTLDFLDFDVNSYTISTCPTLPGDAIKVYDGTDNTGTPLHLQFLDQLGNPLYPNGFMNGAGNVNIGIPPSVSGSSGSLYVEFYKNCGSVSPGFEAKWSTQIFTPAPPHASFTGPDTIFTNQTAYFNSTSTGYGLDYQWDLSGNGYSDATDSSVSYQYTSPGSYNVRLVVYSCDYTDTVVHTLVVVNPTSKPVVDFVADYVRVTPSDMVSFTDMSYEGIYDWRWEITPATVNFVGGTDMYSQNPKVKFTDIGNYDIKLVATNGVGSDSLTKSAYIFVYETCNPSVAKLNADIGMSEVIIQNVGGDTLLDNTSAIGKTAYSDFSAFRVNMYKSGSYTITMNRNSNFNKITRTIYIDFNQDGDYYDAGEKVANQSNVSDQNWSVSIMIPTTVSTGLTKMRIAANAGQLANSGCGPNFSGEFEDYGIEIMEDNNKPVITLMGGDTVQLGSCGTFTDPGYTAWDNETGDLTNQVTVVGTVNSTTQGYYPFTYDVTDPAGNIADQVTRVVEVLPDLIPPTIVITGKNPDSVAVFGTFTDQGYTVTDDCSGMASDGVTGSVNTSAVGWDTLTYTAKDKAGNTSMAYRYVYTYDDVDPTITLKGADPFKMDVFTSFNDPGVDVKDNYYNNLTYTVTGYVDTSRIGSYFLTYCVTDGSDNGPVCVDRTVIVEDNEAPTITLNGDNMTIDVFDNFVDPGVSVMDNYWSVDNIILTTSGIVNTYKLGEYTVTYFATDASGNVSASVNRKVTVVDREAPTVELLGSSIVNIFRWADYTDAGVKVHDNYYSDKQLTINDNTNGTFENTLLPGLYTYTYSVCDPSNNCSGDMIRTIYVAEDPNSGINEAITDGSINYYPNPAKDNMTIEVGLENFQQVTISIYNTLGEQITSVYSGMIKDNSFVVDLKGYSAGIYYIKFETSSNDQLFKKFIIVK